MSQKKPYKDSKKSRTVPYNNKQNRTSTVKNKEDKELSKTKKLENTVRIRIDEDRLNDSDSLDTSFLSGRVNTKAQKEKILRERKEHIINISRYEVFQILINGEYEEEDEEEQEPGQEQDPEQMQEPEAEIE